MQKSIRVEAGWTVDAAPYTDEELEEFIVTRPPSEAQPEFEPSPMDASPVNAPVHFITEVFPCSVNVPVMFGPNITGYLSKSDFSNDTSYTGVFSQTERGSAWGGGSSGYENTWDRPYFSASASNSAYGSSSVVQPASIRMTLCIKI